jgi:hypothetical protein
MMGREAEMAHGICRGWGVTGTVALALAAGCGDEGEETALLDTAPSRSSESNQAIPTSDETDGSSHDEPGSDGRDTGGVDGPVVFGREIDFAMEALMVGRVELVEDCLVVHALNADGKTESVTVVVWPYGTSWNEAEAAVELPNGGEVRIGDRIGAGGGGARPDQGLEMFVIDPDALDRIKYCLETTSTDTVYLIQGSDSVGPPPAWADETQP